MNLAAVIGLLDPEANAELAAWCEAELRTRSIDPAFAARNLALSAGYAEPVDDRGLWLATALLSATYIRSYEWLEHIDTHGTSAAADAAHASVVRALWEQVAVLSGASDGAAQVVGSLAQTWMEPVSGEVTQEMWSELVATAESLAR